MMVNSGKASAEAPVLGCPESIGVVDKLLPTVIAVELMDGAAGQFDVTLSLQFEHLHKL